MSDDREPYGRIVRETWVAWAKEQEHPKPGWFTGWDELDNGQREVDMRIGSAVAARAVHDAGTDFAAMQKRLRAFAAHMPAIRDALEFAEERARAGTYEARAKRYRAALEALGSSEEEAGRG